MSSAAASVSSPLELAAAQRLRRAGMFVRRYWWLPTLLVGLSVVGQAAWILTRPASYTALGRMWVGGKVRLPESSYFSEEWQNFFGTQVELLQSEKIRRRAVARVADGSSTTNRPLIKVDVTQPRKTTIFNLSAQGEDAAALERYLNAVMDEYLQYKKEVRASSSDETVASLSEQLEKVEREIASKQEYLADFQRSNNVSVLREMSVSSGNQLNRLHLQMAELRLEEKLLSLVSPEEQIERQVDLAGLEPRSALGAALPGTLTSRDYFSVRQQRELKRLEQRELTHLRPEHPKMIKLGEDIARYDALLEIYLSQGRDQLQQNREALRLKIQAVEEAMSACEPRVIDANTRLAQYERSKMELDRIQAVQDRLLQAIRNVDVNKSVDQESVSIMDRAFTFPTPRRLPLRLAVAAVVGVLVGLGCILFLEHRDQRVLTPGELRSGLSARLLGCVPEMAARRRSEPLRLLSPEDTRHAFVESFRSLRAALRTGASAVEAPRLILVTSAVPGEGKSTVAVNLALTLAFTGSRVLLIDADVRRGRLSQMLGFADAAGFGDWMQQRRAQADCIRESGTPGLRVLSAGTPGTRTGELLARGDLASALEELRSQYDYVVMDSSPVLATADSCTLAPLADAVLFVVRARSTSLSLARRGMELLQEHRAVLWGAVFNRVEPSASDYAVDAYWQDQPALPSASRRGARAVGLM